MLLPFLLCLSLPLMFATYFGALGIVWVSSHSFGVGIVHRLFFWIPYFVRKVQIFFENCSQQTQSAGELDQPVH